MGETPKGVERGLSPGFVALQVQAPGVMAPHPTSVVRGLLGRAPWAWAGSEEAPPCPTPHAGIWKELRLGTLC